MDPNKKSLGWKLALASCLIIGEVGAIASFGNCALAQITPDRTLPNNSRVTPNGDTNIISGGTQAGSNLFHSFEEFSVLSGSTANFNNAADIQNIISRVTGKSVSNIDGLIRANGTANLFLINPNGIIFGQNASLNIGGSFLASTANAIGFGDQGFFSADNPESSSPLLTVNPSALLFNRIQTDKIQNNSVAPSGLDPSGEFTATGLRVPDGKSLLLVGGDINMDGGGLFAFGGRVELGGLSGVGTVGLNGDGNNSRLSFPDHVERSDVFLSNGAVVNVRAGDGGSIAVNARNFEITGESGLFAGIGRGLGSDNSKAGNIEVNATEVIDINKSFIANEILLEASGQGGDVNISASTLQVRDKTQVGTTTFGKGKGGNLTVNAQNVQLIGKSTDGQFPSILGASTQPNSTGDAGDLTINTNTLLVDGAVVYTSTFGEGKGGNLTVHAQNVQVIGRSANGQPSGLFASAERNSTGNAGDLKVKTNTLVLQDGAQVIVSTFGQGNSGNLTIDAQNVQVLGESADGQFPSALFTYAQPNSSGDAGDLTIQTNTLLVRDGAQVSAGTLGAGKGGNLTVHAQNVQLIGTPTNGQFASGLFASAGPNSTGDAGDLKIKTNTLLVRDGAQVSAGTLGAGKGGNLTVHAQNVQVIGESKDGQFPSALSTSAQPNSTGDAGDLTINTNTLLVDGAVVNTGTSGEGKGGNLTVHAKDVQVIGRSADGQFPSALGTSAQPNSTGDAGDLTINTNTLLVLDGAQVATGTFGAGKGGNLTVNAQNVQVIDESKDGQFPSTLTTSAQPNSTGDAGDLTIKTNILLVDGAAVYTSTFGAGKGGNLTVNAQNVQVIGESADGRVPSGLATSAQPNSTGDAGDLTIQTNTLLVQDGAQALVQSSGTGTAGNMTLNARSIRLNNNALLSGNTRSDKVNPNRQQATININSQDLIMSRNSNIFTNATGENVIGGNINIDTDFLIAFKNSDISANSLDFRGGNVRINAIGIFGTQFRDVASQQTSDITATGASPQFSGSVELNTPDTDPNSGLVELPTIPVNTEVSQGCYSPNVAQSRFVITGRGGLPPNPKDVLTPDAAQVNWVSVKPSNNNRSLPPVTSKPTKSTPRRIVEATGAVLNAKGEVVLVAHSPTVTRHADKQNSIQCYGR